LQRQYFDELQIQFQPGVGINGISTQAPNNIRYISNPYVIASDGYLIVGSLETVSIGNYSTINQNTPTVYPQAMLRWSNDGGSTWSKYYTTTIGQQGRYKNRAIWRRLGMARDRVFEVSITDPVKAVIVSANLKGSEGEN
jgi:hypothetical protein